MVDRLNEWSTSRVSFFLLVRAICILCGVRFPVVGKQLVHACQTLQKPLIDRPEVYGPQILSTRDFWEHLSSLGCCNRSRSCDKVLAVSPQCTHRGRRLTPVLRYVSHCESRIQNRLEIAQYHQLTECTLPSMVPFASFAANAASLMDLVSGSTSSGTSSRRPVFLSLIAAISRSHF